jgi:predicted pyridoxine 5'-phosphate oxidase superfamily flavin-nucleotide-binding protein|tara:strand:+ start:85 stop:528 length:444 start_codon:yes stop_codon:yes gene_type:complete
MVIITEEIKKFVDFQKLGYVATVSIDNTPNLSPKGTIIVLDESHLAFAHIHSPQTVENLKHNSSIEVNVVDPFSRKGYRFKGITEIISNGNKFNKIISYYKKLGVKSPIKSIILVKIENVSEVLSPLYDLGYTEEELKTKWKKHYKF